MADLESSLRTLTLQDTAVTAAFASRLYWDLAPDNVTYPIIRAQTISDIGNRSHNGTYGGMSVVQFDVWDNDKATCNAGAETIRAWLDNYRGGMGVWDVTIQVRNVFGGWDEVSRLFRRLMQIEILYMKRI